MQKMEVLWGEGCGGWGWLGRNSTRSTTEMHDDKSLGNPIKLQIQDYLNSCASLSVISQSLAFTKGFLCLGYLCVKLVTKFYPVKAYNNKLSPGKVLFAELSLNPCYPS